MPRTRSVRKVLFAALVAFLLECAVLFGYTMDDAFISFRYARNLARGEGLVYNRGEPPVEGYSNFLWTILFVPAIGLGWNPEFVSKVLGIACGLGVIGFTIRLSRTLNPDSRLRAVGPALVATSPIMAMQAITGLETHLFGLFFLVGLYLTVREWETGAKFPVSTLAFLGCALTRPEGAFLFVVSLLAALTLHGRPTGQVIHRRFPAAWFVLSILLFGATYGVYTVWRLAYFGSLIPNTFYAKTAGVRQIQEGWEYLQDFSIAHGGLFLYLIGFIAIVFRWRNPVIRYLTLTGVVFLAMVVYEGGDWMPLFRLFAPVLPVLFLLFQEGAGWLYEASREWLLGFQVTGREKVLSTAVIAGMLILSLAPLPAKAREAMARQVHYERAHRAYSRWLADHTPRGEAIALSDIGQFGYYSDLPVIDLVGLTDPDIARAEGLFHEKKTDPEVVLSRRPAHVVLGCDRREGEWVPRGFPTETALLASPQFQSMYTLQTVIHYKDDYSYWLFSRNDLKDFEGSGG